MSLVCHFIRAGGAVCLAAACSGCANPQRSRDLANPQVAASVLARQVCANCHGQNGNATSPNFPNLAGQPPAYLEAQLKAFRERRRQDPAAVAYMWGLARSLSDEQISGLAHYFADQAPRVAPDDPPDARVEAGRSLYERGRPEHGIPACASCHGDHGQGLGPFPRLAGQSPGYITRQLAIFRGTPEQRPDATPMVQLAQALSTTDARDLAAYLQALP